MGKQLESHAGKLFIKHKKKLHVKMSNEGHLRQQHEKAHREVFFCFVNFHLRACSSSSSNDNKYHNFSELPGRLRMEEGREGTEWALLASFHHNIEQQTVFPSFTQCFIFHHISINKFGIEVRKCWVEGRAEGEAKKREMLSRQSVNYR